MAIDNDQAASAKRIELAELHADVAYAVWKGVVQLGKREAIREAREEFFEARSAFVEEVQAYQNLHGLQVGCK